MIGGYQNRLKALQDLRQTAMALKGNCPAYEEITCLECGVNCTGSSARCSDIQSRCDSQIRVDQVQPGHASDREVRATSAVVKLILRGPLALDRMMWQMVRQVKSGKAGRVP
jgi:hypothetical protein